MEDDIGPDRIDVCMCVCLCVCVRCGVCVLLFLWRWLGWALRRWDCAAPRPMSHARAPPMTYKRPDQAVNDLYNNNNSGGEGDLGCHCAFWGGGGC